MIYSQKHINHKPLKITNPKPQNHKNTWTNYIPQNTPSEIETLQKMRATLEIVREATDKIHQDLLSATDNQRAISTEITRTTTAIEKL